jgi:hypothetical protein
MGIVQIREYPIKGSLSMFKKTLKPLLLGFKVANIPRCLLLDERLEFIKSSLYTINTAGNRDL